HQVTYPNTFFNWLSVVPRAGARFTYYSDTGVVREFIEEVDPVTGDELDDQGTIRLPRTVYEIDNFGSDFRTVFNLGVEASFKVSKEFPDVQNRRLGLDSLRHILQ